jgi:hypothetical protein
MTKLGVAPSAGADAKLYSEALGLKFNLKRFKLTVKPKENQSPETIKGLSKSKKNPIKIKVGINTLKSLKNGKVLIETILKKKSRY